MTAYLLTTRRFGDTRWSFAGCELDRDRVEDVYRVSAGTADFAISRVAINSALIDARSIAALGFDAAHTIEEPPAEVLKRTDG